MIPKLSTIIPVALSALAIVLSQFKPLHEQIAKPDIQVNLSKSILVNQGFGNIGINHYIQITNIGDKQGIINRMVYFLKKKGDNTFENIAEPQFYFLPSVQSNVQIPIGEIILNPNEKWENYVGVYRQLSKSDEKTVSSLSQKISKEITRQRRSGNLQPLIPFSIYNELLNYVNPKISSFTIGEYYLLVCVWRQGATDPVFKTCYQFSVYDFDVQKLKQAIDDYSIGLGIVGPPNQANQILASLTVVTDPATVSTMYGELIKNMNQ
jgi:hypothetical protein